METLSRLSKTDYEPGKILYSEKVDAELIQDIVDRMLEFNGEYIEELKSLNARYTKENMRHKREARLNGNNLRKLNISEQ